MNRAPNTNTIIITLPGLSEQDYSFSQPEEVKTRCYFDDFNIYEYECSDGRVVTTACNGTDGIFTSYCSAFGNIPKCATVDSDGNAMHNECKLLSYDFLSTTCSCTVDVSLNDGFRRLQNNAKTVEVNYVAMLGQTSES
jgi:hypothetical protein